MPMLKRRTTSATVERALEHDIAGFTHDPYGFVMYSFPWGSGELKGRDGPEEWQESILRDVGNELLGIEEAIQKARASGHGIGKSALVAWLILWGISTMEDTKGVVTANTETQLKTKTWSELGKWYRLFIARHWFVFTATAIFSADKSHEKTWRIDMIPWSERNTEAFAGLHNQGKRIIVIFDEASAIPDIIWEVTEGALTDENTEIMWFAFGNPTRATGRFRECFRKFRHRWECQQIDSRDVSFTNKKQIAQWIADYGEDSDFVKVRVKGEFPNISDRQFIGTDIVEAAMKRDLPLQNYSFAPKIIGVDPSWTGSDEFVIALRQGLFSKILGVYPKNDDDWKMASIIANFEDEEQADAVFIDMGYGTGIYSAGKQLKRNWRLVSFGASSPDPGFYKMRTFMWGQLKKWLQDGGAIPDDTVLHDDLIGPEYTMRDDGKIILESKDDMKDRGIPSPNRADAICLTFAAPVASKQDMLESMGLGKIRTFRHRTQKYDPFDGI